MKDYEIPKSQSMSVVDTHRVVSAINGGSNCQWRDDGDKIIVRTKANLPLPFVELPEVHEGEIRVFKLVTSTSTQNSGRRTPLPQGDHGARKRWLEQRAGRCGFELLNSHSTDSLVHVEKNPGKRFCMDRTVFIGTLRVTNRELFKQALETGITGGKGTAYGFGLITV